MTADGRHTYVTNSGSNNVSVIEIASNVIGAGVGDVGVASVRSHRPGASPGAPACCETVFHSGRIFSC
jgi:YVTN family beta-propeller protein